MLCLCVYDSRLVFGIIQFIALVQLTVGEGRMWKVFLLGFSAVALKTNEMFTVLDLYFHSYTRLIVELLNERHPQ